MLLKALLLILLFQLSTSKDTITWNGEQVKDGDLLVSKGNDFELGFFSPRNSSYRYVGIWYSMSQISDQTVVWVANRNNPINDTSGVLTINRYGKLVIYAHNMENVPIWSANMSRSVIKTNLLSAQLLDTGNLVLTQDGKTESFIIWQSFDYPTDTLIPGMKLGVSWKTGLEWFLTSWKSPDDPGTGDYSHRLHWNQTAMLQYFLFKGLTTRVWRSDPGPWRNFVSNNDETYYLQSSDNSTIKFRMVVNDSGLLQHLTWNDGDHQWKELWAAPKYRCDLYGQCGAYSKCNPDNINMFECECLPGYEPKSINDWNQNDGSEGCLSKRVGVSKCGVGDGFLEVARVKAPDTSTVVARLDTGMSAKECKQECLRNCSCTACMSINNKGRIDCLTWYGELLDIVKHTDEGQVLHVRVDEIELAMYSRKSEGFLERRGMLAIPILSGLLVLVLIPVFGCWWLKKRRKTKDLAVVDELGKARKHPDLQFFSLSTIIVATGNFHSGNKLGEGGFGSVYKGQLPNGQEIAVKRLSKTSGQGIEEFKNEVVLIERLQHRNLVKLLGCCIAGEEKMLVLEYLSNKSLDFFLFDDTRRSSLGWKKRFEIINGIARGILYLHQDSRVRIIHRDLKTSNILLDAEMHPKISDFGMARIFYGDQLQDKTARVVGTYGYMSPEYAVFGRYSTKSDVFSFGIIILEIISGKKNSGSYWEDHSMNLIGNVWQMWGEDRALEIMDSSLELYQPDEVLRCIQVGLLCVQEDSKDRPTMSDAVFMLSGEASLSTPKQPAFVFRKSACSNVPSLASGLCSINDLTITNVDVR
ncbi:putative protein kinase RLK-Pelle-DLSV family [Rosa chinensis]|uniref:Receptor-like serine/threonine-protein kinase n=1 Tax=Rosa chinensis TaxID=74649 RepID=A0A2P6PDR1_ROSCH|nr:G-type lectin S-receptor-like serine/threonine-protein kinase At1g11410 isoform X1 [Rosa chinensis]PRQ20067.1 putative protein kinase RLK-Pelle-DLSV family [Rosa chinensis]